jgi:SAM-dependent methyltransferase
MDTMQLLQPEIAKLLALGCAQLVPDCAGINARLYDSIQGGTRDVEYYLRKIGPTPATVLELGSGTGRIAIPLAQAGHTVYALDSSPDMHRLLRSKVPDRLRSRVVNVEATMCAFSLDASFDCIILGLNTVFALVEAQERSACFRAVRQHLKANGQFIVDFSVPSASLLSNKDGKYSLSVSGNSPNETHAVLTYNRYDAERQLSILNFLTMEVVDAKVSALYVTSAAEYYPSPAEMQMLIEDAGMQVTEILGDYDGHPFLEAGERRDVIMVARPILGG